MPTELTGQLQSVPFVFFHPVLLSCNCSVRKSIVAFSSFLLTIQRFVRAKVESRLTAADTKFEQYGYVCSIFVPSRPEGVAVKVHCRGEIRKLSRSDIG